MRNWMKPAVVIAILVAVLAACSSSSPHASAGATKAPPIPKASAATPTLMLATATGIEAVAATDGALRYRVDNGVATADGSAVMATEGDRLVVRDARTGAVSQTVLVGPGLAVSAISPNGHMVALTTTRPTRYLPSGRTRTELVVVHLPGGGTVRRYDLAGNLAPDSFNADGSGLFLVSYLPPEAPDRYQITSLQLDSEDMFGVFGREKEALEDMRGLAGTRVLAPSGNTLYTLYLRPPPTPGAASAADSAGDLKAEVHTLALDQGWAHCIDLPADFGGSDLSASTLAVSPDGARLYVVDRAKRQLVEVDTAVLAITRSTSLPLLSSTTSPTSLVVSGDGHLYLSDGPSILVVNTDTLTVAGRWTAEGPVTSLVLTPDGTRILAGSPGLVDVFAPSGVRMAATMVPSDATAISRILT